MSTIGPTGRDLIQYAVRRGFIPQSDAPSFENNIIYLSSRNGVQADHLLVIMAKESVGINPNAGESCFGLIQFCRPDLWGFRKGMTAVQQTAPGGPIDKYFSTEPNKPQTLHTRDLASLYLCVLCPAYKNLGRNEPINQRECNVSGQSSYLVDSSGQITKVSLERGLLRFVQELLGKEPQIPGPATGAPNPNGVYTAGGNFLAGVGTFLAISASRSFTPMPTTQNEAMRFLGGILQPIQASLNGSSFGATSPGFMTGGPATSAGALPYPGALSPGAYACPCKGTFTSGFGSRGGRNHNGIDIAAPVGTPIYASLDGRVIFSGWNNGGFGNLVKLQHQDGSETWYAHNSRLLVSTGQTVPQGHPIAEMGSTGRSSGPHLHFEIHISGRAVNPMSYLRTPCPISR